MKETKPNRIILTGFMGTGKTAVGQALAAKLGFDFLDTDLMVEKETGKTITEIFEKEGEPSFRAYEKKMIRKALKKERVVIATGGGAVTDPENLTLLKEKGALIALSASPERILERVQSLKTRPLLKDKEPMEMETIKNLLSRRSVYYRQADRIIDTTGKNIDEACEEILKFVHADVKS